MEVSLQGETKTWHKFVFLRTSPKDNAVYKTSTIPHQSLRREYFWGALICKNKNKLLIYGVHCFKVPILIGMYLYLRLWGKITTQSLQLLNNPQHKGSYLRPNCSFRIWKPRFCQFSQQIGRYNGTFPTNTITDRKWCNVSRCFFKWNRTQTHMSVSRRNSFM